MTVVNDSGHKFTAGVNDTSHKFMQVINLPAINHTQIPPLVMDTGDKFMTCVT